MTHFAVVAPPYYSHFQALQALAVALRRGAVTFTVETVDARPATASPIAARLREAGFAAVPRGFRWRG